jgi:hypothetical protein
MAFVPSDSYAALLVKSVCSRLSCIRDRSSPPPPSKANPSYVVQVFKSLPVRVIASRCRQAVPSALHVNLQAPESVRAVASCAVSIAPRFAGPGVCMRASASCAVSIARRLAGSGVCVLLLQAVPSALRADLQAPVCVCVPPQAVPKALRCGLVGLGMFSAVLCSVPFRPDVCRKSAYIGGCLHTAVRTRSDCNTKFGSKAFAFSDCECPHMYVVSI